MGVEHEAPAWRRAELAYISTRQDRFLVGRDSWTERDWRQHKADAEKRARKADLIASLDPPLVIPPTPTVAGFSLFDRTKDEDRRRRLEANRNLEKYGARPRTRW